MAVSASSKRSRLTSLLGVGVVYLLLGGLLYWAITQPLTRLTGTVAALVVLGGWLPAYLYLRWAEIRGNPVFWISHGLALGVTGLAAFFSGPRRWNGMRQSSRRRAVPGVPSASVEHYCFTSS